MGLHSYANTRDANEPEIVDALLAAGASVDRVDTPCDLIVGYYDEILGPQTILIEVKLPPGPEGGISHSKLTPKEMEFSGRHKGRYFVARCIEDALRAIGKRSSAIVSGGVR